MNLRGEIVIKLLILEVSFRDTGLPVSFVPLVKLLNAKSGKQE